MAALTRSQNPGSSRSRRRRNLQAQTVLPSVPAITSPAPSAPRDVSDMPVRGSDAGGFPSPPSRPPSPVSRRGQRRWGSRCTLRRVTSGWLVTVSGQHGAETAGPIPPSPIAGLDRSEEAAHEEERNDPS